MTKENKSTLLSRKKRENKCTYKYKKDMFFTSLQMQGKLNIVLYIDSSHRDHPVISPSPVAIKPFMPAWAAVAFLGQAPLNLSYD